MAPILQESKFYRLHARFPMEVELTQSRLSHLCIISCLFVSFQCSPISVKKNLKVTKSH